MNRAEMAEDNVIKALETIGKVPVSTNYNGSLVEIRKAYDVLYKEIQSYRAIGTVDEFKELKEKSTPKKPVEQIKLIGVNKGGKCPACGNWINSASYWNHCECGQAVDWNGGE